MGFARKRELMTYAHLQRGSDASWMRLFVHPNVAAPLDDFVGTILNERPPTQNRPIFCRLRRSQQVGRKCAAGQWV